MYLVDMEPDLIRGHLETLLLAALADEPGHGYALSQRLAARTGGELEVPEGSLYPALQRLERRGLVSSSWSTFSGRRRRIYEVTVTGRRRAARAAHEWRVFSAAVSSVLERLA